MKALKDNLIILYQIANWNVEPAEIASIVKAAETTEIVTESVGVKRGSFEITVAESLGF